MKLRTIATGISLESTKQLGIIEQAAQFNQQAKNIFEQERYEVQTTRIATNSWGEYLVGLTPNKIVKEISNIEKVCGDLKIDLFSIGHVSKAEQIALIPEINQNTSIIYCSSKIGYRENGINFENVRESAKVIKNIAEKTENGYGKFRFCAGANCPPEIPFSLLHTIKETHLLSLV